MKGEDPIARAFRRQDERASRHVVPGEAPPEPDRVKWERLRTVKTRQGVYVPQLRPTVGRDDARALVFGQALAYLHDPNPTSVLLIQLTAGGGKSHIGVELTHEMSRLGRLGAWIAPRHKLFPEVMTMVERTGGDPTRWYEWLPHQAGDPSKGKPETCQYPAVITRVAQRGLRTMDACESLPKCGWAWINGGCVWHGQKLRVQVEDKRVVFCQHKHLVVGHPLSGSFDYAIGDENPLDAVPAVWSVPAAAIEPTQLPVAPAFRAVLRQLARLALSGQRLFGRDLLGAVAAGLGAVDDGAGASVHGPAGVRAACRAQLALGATVKVNLPTPDDAALLDFNHARQLAAVLEAEAAACLEGREYAARVIVGPLQREDGGESDYTDDRGLTILGRHAVPWRGALLGSDQGWPGHMLWLDATADPKFYELILQRPVEVLRLDVEAHQRVFQVTDRQNGVGDVRGRGADPETGEKPLFSRTGADLVADVRHLALLYLRRGKRVGIVTYKWVVESGELAGLASLNRHGREMVGWFGAERGSNDFTEVDCLIVAGTPQPPPEALHRLALCLVLGPDGKPRMEPFLRDGQLPRDLVERAYVYVSPDGRTYLRETPCYPSEPDLDALLWQKRDAELIQAVNRARGVLREPDDPVDVWLLTNHPTEIPLARLITRRELYDAPAGVEDPDVWPAVVAAAEAARLDQGYLTSSGLAAALAEGGHAVSGPTADKYVRLLIDHVEGWDAPAPGEMVALARGRRGRPPKHVAVYRGEDE